MVPAQMTSFTRYENSASDLSGNPRNPCTSLVVIQVLQAEVAAFHYNYEIHHGADEEVARIRAAAQFNQVLTQLANS